MRESFPGFNASVSKGIIRELNKLSTNKGSRGASVRLSIKAVKSSNLNVESDSESGDDWIISEVMRERDKKGIKVVTNDTALAKKVKSLNAKAFKLTKDGKLR